MPQPAVALLACSVGLLVAAARPRADTPRIAIAGGGFVDSATRQPFVPLGANYYRVGPLQEGKVGHATFCPGSYDRSFVEKMMADLAGWGFNTIRTFHVYHVGETGILVSPQAREISPAYLDNVVHFLQTARAHRLRVIFSWDIWLPPSDWWSARPLPGEADCDLRAEWDQTMGVNNFRLHRGSVRTRANGIVTLIEALRARDPDLLAVVLAWELENEACLSQRQAPFAERAASFTFAGRDYALASDAEAQTLMDRIFVQWANCCADAIHQADPQALVSCSVFTFAAVGRGGPGTLSQDQTTDERIPARLQALLGSRLDFVDVHLYAWRTAEQGVADFLRRNLESAEWQAVRQQAAQLGKPILCGECGVFANYLRSAPDWQRIDHALGLRCLREHVAGLRREGLAGALYWAYGNPDSTVQDENPSLVLFPEYGTTLLETWRTSPAPGEPAQEEQ